MSYQQVGKVNRVLLQTFMNVLGTDKDKVHHDQTLTTTKISCLTVDVASKRLKKNVIVLFLFGSSVMLLH